MMCPRATVQRACPTLCETGGAVEMCSYVLPGASGLVQAVNLLFDLSAQGGPSSSTGAGELAQAVTCCYS